MLATERLVVVHKHGVQAAFTFTRTAAVCRNSIICRNSTPTCEKLELVFAAQL
jgi:hypothetical protein